MARWIFVEEILGLKHVREMSINLDCVATIATHLEEAELVIFFAKAHIDPHVLAFKNKKSCQEAYDDLKLMLKYENKRVRKQ